MPSVLFSSVPSRSGIPAHFAPGVVRMVASGNDTLRRAARAAGVVLLGLAAVAAAPSRGLAGSEWATKMFSTTSHNFGTVAKGSKTEFRFVFRNIYKEDLHVVGVRTSCGCTSPEVTVRDLKTNETGEVVAKFNTRTFLGQHGATLTVTFDKPYFAEVQLRVAGNIRGDVTFDPPFVDLGNVELGKGAQRSVRVTHVGSTPWEIKDVRSANANFEVALSKPAYSASQSAYDLTVRLKPETGPGYVNGQLILVTNDPRAAQIPMDVEGRVVAEVTVSPQLLALGSVQPGASITKNIVVRANRPFSVTGVSCSDGCLTCEPKQASAAVHILPVTFEAGAMSGRIERQLKISTDLGENAVPLVTVQATVEAAAGVGQSASTQSGRP